MPLTSTVLRFGRKLECGSQRVVHNDSLAVAQFKNPGGHDRLTFFQSGEARDEIAAFLPELHNLLLHDVYRLNTFFAFLCIDDKYCVAVGGIKHGRCRDGEHLLS